MYLKNHPPRDRSIPGPGEYSEGPKLGQQAVKYSIKGRTANPCNQKNNKLLDLQTVKNVPGPGAYEPKTSLNKNG